MKRSHRRSEGLGLVEVIIAVAVLAIGILAMAQLQVSALSFTSRAESMRTLTRVAEAEIAWQQLNTFTARLAGINCPDGDCGRCDSELPAGVTCRLALQPCGVVTSTDGDETFVCAAGVSPAQAVEIRVDVTDARGNDLSLQRIATGRFVAGIRSTSSDTGNGGDPPSNGNDDPPGEPDPPAPPGTENPPPGQGNRPPNVGGGGGGGGGNPNRP